MSDLEKSRTMSNDDIQLLVNSIVKEFNSKNEKLNNEYAKFKDIDPDDLKNAVEFFKSFKSALDDTKSTVRRFMVVSLMTIILGLLGLGIVTKFKG